MSWTWRTKTIRSRRHFSRDCSRKDSTDTVPRYKIGDTYISLPVPEIQEMLAVSTEKIENSISSLTNKLSTIREEMEQLKVQLYARFGKSINLET